MPCLVSKGFLGARRFKTEEGSVFHFYLIFGFLAWMQSILNTRWPANAADRSRVREVK